MPVFVDRARKLKHQQPPNQNNNSPRQDDKSNSCPMLVFGERARKFKRLLSPNQNKKQSVQNKKCKSIHPNTYTLTQLREHFDNNVIKNWPCHKRSAKVSSIKQFGTTLKYTVVGLACVHFCYNVNREHRHKNIYFVILPTMDAYVQKCHHPSCRNFRSHRFQLIIN